MHFLDSIRLVDGTRGRGGGGGKGWGGRREGEGGQRILRWGKGSNGIVLKTSLTSNIPFYILKPTQL